MEEEMKRERWGWERWRWGCVVKPTMQEVNYSGGRSGARFNKWIKSTDSEGWSNLVLLDMNMPLWKGFEKRVTVSSEMSRSFGSAIAAWRTEDRGEPLPTPTAYISTSLSYPRYVFLNGIVCVKALWDYFANRYPGVEFFHVKDTWVVKVFLSNTFVGAFAIDSFPPLGVSVELALRGLAKKSDARRELVRVLCRERERREREIKGKKMLMEGAEFLKREGGEGV